MPDAMDRLQDFNDDHVSDALKRHQQRPRQEGRANCANLECGDAINPQQQAMGAQLCVVCQRAEEAVSTHLRVWRGR